MAQEAEWETQEMMENGDGEAVQTGQSKRPPLSQHGSDSQASDQAQQQQNAYRPRVQKHVVGGGTGGRFHARVPSSKIIHKHHASTSSSKLNRRQASPSPERGIGSQFGSTHRRVTSDIDLSRKLSATNLSKNSSHTNLKYSRSKVDIGKKSKSSANLKRSLSNPAVHKLKSANVHFNLGDEAEDGQDGQEDEWVDASTSASPLLSRRTSVVSGGQSSVEHPASRDSSRPHSSPAPSHQFATENGQSSGTNSVAHSLDRRAANHQQYLTSRLLQRNPSLGVPPKMSAENVSVHPSSSRQHSPDSGGSRDTISTLSGTPRMPLLMRPGSSGKEELTSRFVTNNSQGSGSGATGDSFLVEANRGGLSRAAYIRAEGGPRRPQSTGNLAQAQKQKQQDLIRAQVRLEEDESTLTDGDDGKPSGLAGGARSRRTGGYTVSRGEMNRTQQKLDLQRASSSLEPSHHHPGMGMGLAGVASAAGPLVGGSGFEARDPRLGKLMERTGMEYLVVRRYQNPIARSINRLTQLPGVDKARRIPKPGSPSVPNVGAHSRRGSEYGGLRHAQLQNLNERELRDPTVAGLISAQISKRPSTPRRGHTATGSSSIRPSMDLDEAAGRRPDSRRLSVASLADRGEDAQTMALLRNLWDKNMDLSASQE